MKIWIIVSFFFKDPNAILMMFRVVEIDSIKTLFEVQLELQMKHP